MGTLITGDIHLSANPRDRYRINTMRQLVTIAKRKGVTQTIILGDLTEEKDRHSDWLVNQLVEIVCLFSALGDVHILQGNHDSYTDPMCPFFHFLRHMPKVQWHGNPELGVLAGIGRVLWLPFTSSHKTSWAGLPFKDARLIFAHGMFSGARLGHGRTAAEGSIPLEALPRGSACIAGDVHQPQRLGTLEYVGAPYTIDFGDDYRPRVILYDNGRQSDISLARFPQKRLVEFDGAPDEVDRTDDLNEGDILKIRVSLKRGDAARWPEARDRLRKGYTDMGMVVHSIVPVIVEELGPRVRLKAAKVKSDGQVLREFAAHRGLDRGTLKRGERLL